MKGADGLVFTGSAMLLTIACIYKQKHKKLEDLMEMYGEKDDEFWAKKWRKGITGWHLSEPHPDLVAYLSELESNETPGTEARCDTPKSVLVPLCGKSVDIIYLYKKGFTVIGVELIDTPLRQVLEEAKIDYTVKFLSDGAKLFESIDRRIRLVATSIFNIELISNAIGMKVDLVWDRASLIAINPSQRMTYAQAIGKLRKDKAKTLLCVLSYNQRERSGPPWSMSKDMFEPLFPTAKITLFKKTLKNRKSLPRGISQALEKTWLCEPDCRRKTACEILVGQQHEPLSG